jgi:hypothetical protein
MEVTCKNKKMKNFPSYFLISISNRRNLELCIKYALAGFTNSINGLWTYLDIEEGDYISFLYGARVKNLYRVVKKVAYKNAEELPPWPSVTFRMSGNTYYFPFRVYLKQERIFDEPMIRAEFAYVAENLLLRGGYRKTHFQADIVTFYNVSNMGESFDGRYETLTLNAESFVPKIVFRRSRQKIPEKFYFHELILQALVRRELIKKLDKIIRHFNLDYNPNDFEILGEKALPEGFVDVFLKLKHPIGLNTYILVEVKTGKTSKEDFEQLKYYLSEFKGETAGGILVAKDFPKRKALDENKRIIPVKYSFNSLNIEGEYLYEELLKMLKLEVVK